MRMDVYIHWRESNRDEEEYVVLYTKIGRRFIDVHCVGSDIRNLDFVIPERAGTALQTLSYIDSI